MVDSFVCDRCGICCQHIDRVIELKEFDRGDGVCQYLKSNNSCSIYQNRPDICSVETMYKLKYQYILTKEQFYLENTEACNLLKTAHQKEFSITDIKSPL